MKFLHKISVTTILGLLSIPTYAVPNVWTSSFTQGYTEYVLSNSRNQTIIVACNEYADIHSDHGFHYYPKGLNGNSHSWLVQQLLHKIICKLKNYKL